MLELADEMLVDVALQPRTDYRQGGHECREDFIDRLQLYALTKSYDLNREQLGVVSIQTTLYAR